MILPELLGFFSKEAGVFCELACFRVRIRLGRTVLAGTATTSAAQARQQNQYNDISTHMTDSACSIRIPVAFGESSLRRHAIIDCAKRQHVYARDDEGTAASRKCR